MKENYSNMNYQQILVDWNGQDLCDLDAEYCLLRTDIIALWTEVKNELHEGKKYLLDLKFGVKLKEYFDAKEWFNLRLAADIDFWRYLSVCVVPNLVYERWSGKAEDHFWKKPSRIWLRSIWWFAYLGWNNDAVDTYNLLKGEMFNTDIISGTVERTGRKGTPINVYKKILHTYAKLPISSKQDFSSSAEGKSDTLYRSIMRLNTAKIIVVEPELYEGGVEGYVNGLFENLGINMGGQKDSTSDVSSSAVGKTTSGIVPNMVIVDYSSSYKSFLWKGSLHLEVDINNKTLKSTGWTIGKDKMLSDQEKQVYIDFFSNINNLKDFFDDNLAYNTPADRRFTHPTTYNMTVTWGDRHKSISVGYPDIPFQHPFKQFQ